ncbi:MAG: tRNA lysidine(34) synthetase TilS, partial [Magnetococcus sp. DMHC-8]
GLRADSGEDARFVAAEAEQLGLAWDAGRWEGAGDRVGDMAARARAARYRFLLACAHRHGATRVVTGHHRDDQAETFLERLLRGSGVHGLRGMAFSRPLGAGVALVRPLLSFSREAVRAWLVTNGHGWREDASNAKLTARRNMIRHRGLPALQALADPGVAQRLAATAERLAQADAALEWLLTRLWPEWDPCRLAEGGLSLSAEALQAVPDELVCRCLHRCHQLLHGHGRPPGARAVAGFVHLLRSRRRHWSMVVQGLAVRCQQGRIEFRPQQGVAARQTDQDAAGGNCEAMEENH